MTEHDEFEDRLRRALRDRPEPESGINLAAEAMRRGREREAAALRWARWRRRGRWLNVAAAILIIGILAVALWRSPAQETAAGSAEVAWADETEEMAETEWLSDEGAMLEICGVLALGMLLFSAVELSLGEPRRWDWALAN